MSHADRAVTGAGHRGGRAWPRHPRVVRAVSSVVEHRLYTPAVTGSNPVPPNLRSRLPDWRERRLASHAKIVHRSAQREGGPPGLVVTASFAVVARSSSEFRIPDSNSILVRGRSSVG